MSVVLSRKCLQHLELAPKPTEQKGSFLLFSVDWGLELPLEPFSQVSHLLVDLSGFITAPAWGSRAPAWLCQSSSPCLKPVQLFWFPSSVSWDCSQCEV